MRAVIQRVKSAKVMVDNECVGEIGKGLLVFLGVGKDDTEKDVEYLIDKTVNLRIFSDNDDKMNLSLLDINADILIISQFTLYGDCRKGRRPSYDSAARPQEAERLYEKYIDGCRKYGIKVETGVFRAMMDVHIVNDGPVTLLLDSRKEF